jgi:hypothetical protein
MSKAKRAVGNAIPSIGEDGLNKGMYSKEEEEFLIDNFNKIPSRDIAEKMKRSYSSLLGKIRNLGLVPSNIGQPTPIPKGTKRSPTGGCIFQESANVIVHVSKENLRSLMM